MLKLPWFRGVSNTNQSFRVLVQLTTMLTTTTGNSGQHCPAPLESVHFVCGSWQI